MHPSIEIPKHDPALVVNELHIVEQFLVCNVTMEMQTPEEKESNLVLILTFIAQKHQEDKDLFTFTMNII